MGLDRVELGVDGRKAGDVGPDRSHVLPQPAGGCFEEGDVARLRFVVPELKVAERQEKLDNQGGTDAQEKLRVARNTVRSVRGAGLGHP